MAEPWLALVAAACLLPVVPPWAALLAGIGFGVATRGVAATSAGLAGKRVLAIAIVGTGLGLGWEPLRAAPTSLMVGLAIVLMVFAACFLLGRSLGTPRPLNWLLSAGAAVCGGSAIAAVGSSIRASERHLAVALGWVFALNAVAVLAFPMIGRLVGLGAESFGIWVALAVHDTASVAAAASSFGRESVETAMVWKLARAVWILPLAIWAASRHQGERRASIPWFIVGFAAAAVIGVLVDHPLLDTGATLARRGFVAAIFLVGASWRAGMMEGIGWRPLAQLGTIWLVWAGLSLAALVL